MMPLPPETAESCSCHTRRLKIKDAVRPALTAADLKPMGQTVRVIPLAFTARQGRAFCPARRNL